MPRTALSELHIVMFDNGQIEVTGCLDSKVIAYGLLQIAADTIKEYNDNLQKRIVAPSPIDTMKIVSGGRQS